MADQKNILDLLSDAATQNDQERGAAKPAAPAAPSAPTSDPPSAASPAESAPPKRSSLSPETEALIGQYSQRTVPPPDPLSSTAKLRESLSARMAGDKDLWQYYSATGSTPIRSKKVEELYGMLNTASELDDQARRTIPEPVSSDTPHLTGAEKVPKPAEYTQEQLLVPEHRTEDSPKPEDGVRGFDTDYAALGEKIESGEISFGEEDDESQLAMISDNPMAPDDDASEPSDITEPEKEQSQTDENVNGPTLKKRKFDKTDLDLIMAFDMMEETSDLDPEEVRIYAEQQRQAEKPKKRKREKQPDPPAYEYTNTTQNAEITERFGKALRLNRIRLLLTLVLTLVIFVLELIGKNADWMPVYFRPGRYGILYNLIDLQLLLFIAIINLESVRKGVSALFRCAPVAETMFPLALLVSAGHSIVTMFLDPTALTAGLFCLPAACMGLFSALCALMTSRRDLNCFAVVSAEGNKYVADCLHGSTREADEFYQHLLEDSKIYTVRRTAFVEDFFARLQTRPEGEGYVGLMIPLVLLSGLALMACALFVRHESLYLSYTAFTQTVFFATPISALLVYLLPTIAANRIGRRHKTAFIGTAVSEEYADASVISFPDTEVFPARLVRIQSIKVFGDTRIDQIIYDMARVFAFVGGPLRNVASNMLSGAAVKTGNARLIESADDGLCLVLDGHEMFLGKRAYLRRYHFETTHDDGDEAFEEADGSIMFVTSDDRLIAKIYVRYTIEPRFDALLSALYKAGMCVGIKTIDPNITTALLERSIKFKKCPVAILKAGDMADTDSRRERVSSGIVCGDKLHTFLKMFIVSDKLRHVTRSNAIVSLLSLVLSVGAVAFLLFTGKLTDFSSVYPAVYQLLWSLPVWLISFGL